MRPGDQRQSRRPATAQSQRSTGPAGRSERSYLGDVHDGVAAERSGRGQVIETQKSRDDTVLINPANHGSVHEEDDAVLIHCNAWRLKSHPMENMHQLFCLSVIQCDDHGAKWQLSTIYCNAVLRTTMKSVFKVIFNQPWRTIRLELTQWQLKINQCIFISLHQTTKQVSQANLCIYK